MPCHSISCLKLLFQGGGVSEKNKFKRSPQIAALSIFPWKQNIILFQ